MSLGARNNIVKTPKPIDVSKNPRVFEIDQRCIHHKPRKMGGMKKVEVGILDSTTIEIGRWIGFRL